MGYYSRFLTLLAKKNGVEYALYRGSNSLLFCLPSPIGCVGCEHGG